MFLIFVKLGIKCTYTLLHNVMCADIPVCLMLTLEAQQERKPSQIIYTFIRKVYNVLNRLRLTVRIP